MTVELSTNDSSRIALTEDKKIFKTHSELSEDSHSDQLDKEFKTACPQDKLTYSLNHLARQTDWKVTKATTKSLEQAHTHLVSETKKKFCARLNKH